MGIIMVSSAWPLTPTIIKLSAQQLIAVTFANTNFSLLAKNPYLNTSSKYFDLFLGSSYMSKRNSFLSLHSLSLKLYFCCHMDPCCACVHMCVRTHTHTHTHTRLYFLKWSIIVLRRCVSFCCTTEGISYIYTYVPSLLDLPTNNPTPLGHHRAWS